MSEKEKLKALWKHRIEFKSPYYGLNPLQNHLLQSFLKEMKASYIFHNRNDVSE